MFWVFLLFKQKTIVYTKSGMAGSAYLGEDAPDSQKAETDLIFYG